MASGSVTAAGEIEPPGGRNKPDYLFYVFSCNLCHGRLKWSMWDMWTVVGSVCFTGQSCSQLSDCTTLPRGVHSDSQATRLVKCLQFNTAGDTPVLLEQSCLLMSYTSSWHCSSALTLFLLASLKSYKWKSSCWHQHSQRRAGTCRSERPSLVMTGHSLTIIMTWQLFAPGRCTLLCFSRCSVSRPARGLLFCYTLCVLCILFLQGLWVSMKKIH